MAGILLLTTTSPVQPFTEPLTVAEVETFLGITAPSPVDQSYVAELETFIEAAREQAELLRGDDLVEKQYDLHIDDFWTYQIELRRPLESVDLVRYRDSDGNYTTMTEGTDYIVDLSKGLIMPPYDESWPDFTPWPSSAVLIRFTVSAPQYLPKAVKVGMLKLISDWFNDRLPFVKGADAAEGYPARLKMLLCSGARSQVG